MMRVSKKNQSDECNLTMMIYMWSLAAQNMSNTFSSTLIQIFDILLISKKN